MSDTRQAQQMRDGKGFVAALDQSGGSTPKALAAYGVSDDAYPNDREMFDRIHEMRSRIVTAPAFSGDKVIGAILFEDTMDREIEGTPSATYLWQNRGVVPILKVDKGLEDKAQGVQLMRDMGGLDGLLDRAAGKGIFGTKMRSVIHAADADGIAANVAQQFEIGKRIAGHGLVPILEPEISISIPDKSQAEQLLRDAILRHLDALDEDETVMLKLTLPETPGHYRTVSDHPGVMRVVALSGGYSLKEAADRLARNPRMIASFSRALTEKLNAAQSDAEFDATLADTIDRIYDASVAG